MISNDIFSNVNNNILVERNNIRNGASSDFRNGKDYLDQIGKKLINEKLNIGVGTIMEPFDEDETDAYLFKELNNYSDEPLTFEGENALGYNPATYGSMRMNMQYKGSKTGKLPNFYKDFNSNFKRDKIDRPYVEMDELRDQMSSRTKKFQTITYNNDGANNVLSGERHMREVIRDRRKFDKLLTEKYRTVTRNDDDVSGFNRGRQLNMKLVDNTMVESDLKPNETIFNNKLSILALHYSPYSTVSQDGISDVRIKTQLLGQNKQYSIHTDQVDRNNYISDVRFKDSQTQLFANKQNLNYDPTMNFNNYVGSAKLKDSFVSINQNGLNAHTYTKMDTNESMRKNLREDMANQFKFKQGKFERFTQEESRKKSLLSEKMAEQSRVVIKNGMNGIRNGEHFVKTKDSLTGNIQGLNAYAHYQNKDNYENAKMRDISKSLDQRSQNIERYTNLDSELSNLYDINIDKISINPAQLNITNKTALDRSYTQDAKKENIRASDTFVNKHVYSAKKKKSHFDNQELSHETM